MISTTTTFSRRTGALLLVGTVLGGSAAPAARAGSARSAAGRPATGTAAAAAPAPVQTAQGTIRSITVRGNQRLEPETIRAYANLSPGRSIPRETLDQALKDLYATQLFADVTITGADTGDLVISVRENPVINRIILEGNKRLKDDKITPEIKLAPRQIFTRSAVRADVDRILELYRRQGRFAARVEPKIVQLDQNRVDVVFEIYEGDLAKVRAINILGNKIFSDGRLRKEMYTRQAGGVLGFLKSNDTYDPDRLAADQQKLRAFYLTQGYADFRVVQALAELTPDRRDFVITYVVEEGPRYQLRHGRCRQRASRLPQEKVLATAKLQPGSWFDAKQVEDAVTDLNEAAGNLGYAFADINPSYNRDADKKVMNLTIKVGETPRVYVERIDITGNTTTRDKVIRREFRLNEGDAFNAAKVKRSAGPHPEPRLLPGQVSRSSRAEGSTPDRVVLGAQCRGKIDRPAVALGRLFEPRALRRPARRFAEQLHGQGPDGQLVGQLVALFEVGRGGLHRPLFPRQVDPARRPAFPARLQQLQLYRQQPQHDLQAGHAPAAALRLGFPLSEYWNLGTRYLLEQRQDHARQEQLLHRPQRRRQARMRVRATAGTYLVRRGRQAADLAQSACRRSSTIPTEFTRRAASRSPSRRTSRVSAATFATCVPQAFATKYKSFGGLDPLAPRRGRLHQGAAERARARAAIRSASPTASSTRSIRGFDIRGIGPRVVRIPLRYERHA